MELEGLGLGLELGLGVGLGASKLLHYKHFCKLQVATLNNICCWIDLYM